MNKKLLYICCLSAIVICISSCKKDNEKGKGLKAVFSYVADGFKVNFTNFSTNAAEYRWDFGDGSGDTSTKRSPQHVFKSKGDFLVTLKVTNGADTDEFKDSVTVIGPNIKIDGDFSDWEYVDFSSVNPPTFPGTVRAIKTFASSTEIFFYVEGTTDMNMDIVDIYVDGDNNPETGFKTFLYPLGSGADFLFEGSPSGGWGDVFSHVGPGNGFAWSPFTSFAEAMGISSVITSGGKKKIEFSIKKSTLGTISGFINFALVESSSGWAELGKIPEGPTPTSKFIQIQL